MPRRRPPLDQVEIAHIEAMGRAGFDRTQIKGAVGCSGFTVDRVLKAAGIVPTRKPYEWKGEIPDRSRPAPWKANTRDLTPAEPPKIPYDPGQVRANRLAAILSDRRPHPLEVAEVVWERRLVDSGGCLALDGRPIRFSDLMRRTNGELLKLGLAQLGAEPSWKVVDPTPET